MGGTLNFVAFNFPERVRRKLSKVDEPQVPSGYSFSFIRNVLYYDDRGLKTRNYQHVIDENKEYWIVGCRSRDGNLESLGVGRNRNQASDICLSKIEKQIEETDPEFFMPRNLIGYPNVLGHCYLISAVLPLLLSYPFLKVLLDVQSRIIILKTTGKVGARGKTYNLVEPEYAWCNKLFDLHRVYYKVALRGDLQEYNMDVLCSRVGRCNTPVTKAVYSKPRGDLDLHASLVKGLCTYLRSYCGGEYSDIGGDERVALEDILYKLGKEDDVFIRKFFLKVRFLYTCRRCVGGPFKREFTIPVIRSDATHEFQDLLDRPELFAKYVGLTCKNVSGVGICGGVVRWVYRGELLNRPELLFIATEYNSERVELRGSLELRTADGESDTYKRFSGTNRFRCWTTENGEEYGPFYREPLPTDVFDTWHTYPTIKTKTGYLDINNGCVYKCNPELLNLSTPGTIHIYHKEKYEKRLPVKGKSTVFDCSGNLF